MDLTELTVRESQAKLAAKEVSSRELVEACLARIARVDPELGAFLTVDDAGARAQADQSDAQRARGESRGPLDGVPVAVKDLFCTEGLRTTAGSKVLEGFVPPYDATVVADLRAAGMPLLGKLNLDEFAMGSSTENSGFFPCRNPWDRSRTPGGSSGGSAAAVAARLVPCSLGTDTGGSIRQPAALTNLVGLKPTYGRVSRFGVVAFASSLDQPGPLARTVEDVAALMNALARHDPKDSTSAQVKAKDHLEGLEDGVKGLRVGLPKEYFTGGADPEVLAGVEAAAKVYQRLGATLVEVSLPHTRYALPAYYLIAPAEASSNLARYDGVRYGHRAKDVHSLRELYDRTRDEGFGTEVKRRIMLGTYALSHGYYDAYYLKAQQVRTLVRRDFDRAFEQVDVLLSPTTPTAAFALGEKVDDPVAMYLADVFTLPASLAGIPGLSVPCGFTRGGLPVGLQLLGRPFEEAALLRAGRAYEREQDLHRRAPPG